MGISEVSRPLVMQPALSQNVVDILREMITNGTLSAGEHLKEAEIALTLGVSRGPVREALAQLANEGHVELRRHRGAFVSHLTRRDVHEVYSLRLALERLAVERAATHMTSEQLAQMDAVLELMKHVPDDYTPDQAVELSLAFHDLVYEAADHQRLSRSWQFIRSHVAFFLHTRNSAHHDFLDVGYREHKLIRDVLAAGDAAGAVALIEEHIQGPYTYLLADLPEDSSESRRID
ncbi:GntR family transcriptional regulator [Compostimonas suwonensis]|uniref:DNA-binding GntR family transcriptional regulator n=1 Tax=Compostimonas suwonensis TaxID=1048394 RepID=A0A2M9C4Y4_9MICO|nr:GntR family transcriptional regulator [Compostimonas suwonensis]PJJ65576.1 DNA-binding GntR family transcriptional regulator [Compostimonas suwonensis]